MCCLLFHDLFMFYAAVLSSGDFSYRRNDGEYIGFRSNPQFHGAFCTLSSYRRLCQAESLAEDSAGKLTQGPVLFCPKNSGSKMNQFHGAFVR